MTKELAVYEAFDPKDRNPHRSVEFREKGGKRHWLKYTDRHYMALSPEEDALAIFYHSVNVVLWGRQLYPVAMAIDRQSIAWVQQFDEARWTLPVADAPLVGRIEIFRRNEDSDAEQGTSGPRRSRPQLVKD